MIDWEVVNDYCSVIFIPLLVYSNVELELIPLKLGKYVSTDFGLVFYDFSFALGFVFCVYDFCLIFYIVIYQRIFWSTEIEALNVDKILFLFEISKYFWFIK